MFRGRWSWPVRFAPLLVVLVAISANDATGKPPASNAWSRVAAPSAGPAAAIGEFANGCVAGAAPLPLDGPGYAVVRPSRKRFYGHPELVDFVERLGARAAAAGLPVFYVGDMAQPRGGPLPFGHASHQTGLDADIWFTADTRARPTAAERETPVLPSMLLPDLSGVDPARFGPRQVSLLRLAASDPRVDRIFVNPVIKLALCRSDGGAWLRRIRPWWGHDDHFHVRLACPEGSPLCVPQRPAPDGDGCDAALEAWAHDQKLPNAAGPPAKPKPPAACRAVLNSR